MGVCSIPHIASQFLNKPLMTTPQNAIVIVAAIQSRLGVEQLTFEDQEGEIVTLGPAGLASVQEAALTTPGKASPDPKTYDVVDGVGILPITGTLTKTWGLDPYSGMTGYDGITYKVRAMRADPDVKGILLQIDSGGGRVSGCFDLVDEIWAGNAKNGGKPVYASLDEDGYSAAYAIASAADKVFVPRTGGSGSVGVLAIHANEKQAWENEGVQLTVLRSGKYKAEGNPYEALSEEAAARWQAELDETYDLFARTVARNRGMAIRDVKATEALTYQGRHGVEVGFADDIAPFAEAFQKLRSRLNRKR